LGGEVGDGSFLWQELNKRRMKREVSDATVSILLLEIIDHH
jgi:hypothetical protein